MANNCFFMMQVAGDRREEFFRRLKDFGRIYGISGFEEAHIIKADGDCAWSINTAMIDYDFVKLTEEYGVSVEMYSEEAGFAFQEHYYIDKGKIICDECVDYIEICVDDLDEKEIEEEIDNQRMTTEEFMSYVEDGYFRYGGFSNWNFPNMKKYCITPVNVDVNTLSNLLEV